ncbi:MAG TPA: circadian clock KaiB family protein [Thermoleophilia bacterium]|nr:circadian clock KaiB family protein [Thermoleophilia bacterium]
METDPENGRTSLDEHLAEAAHQDGRYVLRLYVTGQTPRSLLAIQNIKQICETHLKGRYDLEVIDIYKRPSLAKGERVIAAPTLVKSLPAPIRRFVGDLSDTEKVLFGLDLVRAPATNEP